jgi:diaminopimelate epimerase
MKFTKMEGCGNDYVYVDAREANEDWSSLARVMSDRHFGVGSDGLILLESSHNANFKMTMFNADGSEGAMCGNGIRCLAKFAIDREIVKKDSESITVETASGIRTVVPIRENGLVTGARVSMGRPILNAAEIPVTVDANLGRLVGDARVDYPLCVGGNELALTFVSMGNPHAVVFLEQPVHEILLHEIGPYIEHHPMFPNGVNFEIVNIVAPGKVRARVWERGSGETMACGTGACAIGVAASLLNIKEKNGLERMERLTVSLPGGDLDIAWDGLGEVFMEGPAVEVFNGEWS